MPFLFHGLFGNDLQKKKTLRWQFKNISPSLLIASITFTSYCGPSFMCCKPSILLLEPHPTNVVKKAS
jgi:hypothetical protein